MLIDAILLRPINSEQPLVAHLGMTMPPMDIPEEDSIKLACSNLFLKITYKSIEDSFQISFHLYKCN